MSVDRTRRVKRCRWPGSGLRFPLWFLVLCLCLPLSARQAEEKADPAPPADEPQAVEQPTIRSEEPPTAAAGPTADAGPTGDAARSGLAETLDREIVRADRHLEALERLSKAVEAERTRELESIRAAETATAERLAELSQLDGSTRSATRIYEALLSLLEGEQPRLADALERTELVPGVAPFVPKLDTRPLDTPAFHEQLADLNERQEQIRQTEAEIRQQQEDGCWQLLDARSQLLSRLYQAREGAIEALPGERRRALLGISREGFDALSLEVERLRIGVETWVHRTLRTLREIPSMLDDLFAVGRLTWIALKLLVVLTLLLALRQRRQALRQKLLEWADNFGATRRGRRRLRSLAELTVTLMPSLLVLLLVLSVRWALGGLASRPEIDIPLRLLFLYGIYALATALTYALALWLTRRYHMSVTPPRRKEILRTIRTVMRVSFFLAALLLLSAHVLGRGVLFHKVVQAAWVIGLIALLFLIARWRPVIAEAYLGAGRERPAGAAGGADAEPLVRLLRGRRRLRLAGGPRHRRGAPRLRPQLRSDPQGAGLHLPAPHGEASRGQRLRRRIPGRLAGGAGTGRKRGPRPAGGPVGRPFPRPGAVERHARPLARG